MNHIKSLMKGNMVKFQTAQMFKSRKGEVTRVMDMSVSVTATDNQKYELPMSNTHAVVICAYCGCEMDHGTIYCAKHKSKEVATLDPNEKTVDSLPLRPSQPNRAAEVLSLHSPLPKASNVRAPRKKPIYQKRLCGKCGTKYQPSGARGDTCPDCLGTNTAPPVPTPKTAREPIAIPPLELDEVSGKGALGELSEMLALLDKINKDARQSLTTVDETARVMVIAGKKVLNEQ